MRTALLLAAPAWVTARCADPPDVDDLWHVEPLHPSTLDDLAVVLTDDADRLRGLTVDVTWKNGGRTFTGSSLPASETTRGEVWRVEVVAHLRGRRLVDHGRVTIENAPPSPPEVTVTPEAPLERADSLHCAATTPPDPDGDPVALTYTWEVNGLLWGAGDTVPFDAIAAHDRWTCRATADDGQGAQRVGAAETGPVSEALGLSMVRLEAGTTLQGVTPGFEDVATGGWTYPREVTLTRPFLLATHELSQALFEETMGYNPSTPPCADCPVHTLTWHEAAAYANALSRDAGLQECFTCTGQGATVTCTQSEPYPCLGYRIPTHIEYTRGARLGGTSTAPWPTGSHPVELPIRDDCIDRELEDGSHLSDHMWGCFNNRQGVQPVGTRRANPMGFYDLSGNVGEWTATAKTGDWSWQDTDPWQDRPDTAVLMFGGRYWSTPMNELLIGNTFSGSKRTPQGSTGFRLARTLPH